MFGVYNGDMDTADFLRHIQSLLWYQEQIVHVEQVPSREARTRELDPPLDARLVQRLEDMGVSGLYTHQAEAVEKLRDGKNVIVATPAASGKSMCYNLPVLESLLEDRTSRALYLYPTKALSQDQEKKLAELMPMSDSPRGVRHAIFDGDTPRPDRATIRRSSNIVITNPDMLHLGILPNHRAWYRTLRGLKYVVLDEAHVYRGVFGTHVANVMKRLRRLCKLVGSSPQFILCSATIANPGEHAERLIGEPFEVVEDDGSPYGGKDFVLWNPPMIDLADGSRRSTNSEATQVFAELLKRHTRTMTFVRSRRQAELIHVYARDQLKLTHPIVAKRISPYRASYLPEDRRRIERDLFEGRLLGLSTTNAMELGVNVGNLDATILTGYPGTIASAWQQAGRSGRGGERSLSVMVANNNPLDQYLMRHPESFFGKSHESARISPANPYIMKPHLICAAYEAPLTMNDTEFFGPELLWYADELIEDEYFHVRHSDAGTCCRRSRTRRSGSTYARRPARSTLSWTQRRGPSWKRCRRRRRSCSLHPGGDLPAPRRVLSHQRPRPGLAHRVLLAYGRSLLHTSARLYRDTHPEHVQEQAGWGGVGVPGGSKRVNARCGIQAGEAPDGGGSG